MSGFYLKDEFGLLASARALLAEWDRDMAVPRVGRPAADSMLERSVESLRAVVRRADREGQGGM